MIVDEPTSAPPPQVRPETSANFASLGMSCAVMSAIGLLYAAEVVFIEMPRAEDVYKSVKVSMGGAPQFVFDYGIALWGLVLICVVLSFDQAFRHPGKTRTLVVNIAVLLGALGFVFVVRRATMYPLMSLLGL